MTQRLLLVLLILGLLAFAPVGAGAVFINFDQMPLGIIDGLQLETFPDGCVITSSDGSTYVALGDQWGWGYATQPNVVTNNGFLIGNPMTITFNIPRGFVSFVGGDAGIDQDRFTVKAYDAANNLITFFDSGVFGGNPLDPNNYMIDQATFTYNGSNFIKYVVVEAYFIDGAGILIDNLEFCKPIPVPPSLLLLGSGLVGLIALRRRS